MVSLSLPHFWGTTLFRYELKWNSRFLYYMMFDLQNVCQMMLIMGEGSLMLCYHPWLEDVDRLHFEMQTIMRAFAEFSFILISVMLTEIVGI